MNLDGNSLFAGFFVSLVGMGCFMYGRKQQRAPQIVFGLVAMVYPYFVAGPAWIFGIFAALLAALWLALRLGW